MKKLAIFLSLISALLMTACSGVDREEEEETVGKAEKINVFTTLYPLQYFTEQIGGQYVQVTNLVPVGADAHTYEPTAKTMIHVANGHMFVYSGAGMEGFVAALITSLDEQKVKIVNASEGVSLLGANHFDEEEAEHGHNHGDIDPHVWLDPLLSIELAKNITEALVQEMPEQEEFFVTNFAQLQNQLEGLHEEFMNMVKEVTKDTFIVSHAGYGYWENRYHLHQVSVTGLSPTNEPSQKQLQAIVQLAREHDLNYIAFEQNISSKVAEAVQKEIGANVVYLHNLEALTEENVANGENYVSLMRKNIESLKIALQ